MAGQDSQSRPAPIRCQQLPVRHSNCHFIVASFNFRCSLFFRLVVVFRTRSAGQTRSALLPRRQWQGQQSSDPRCVQNDDAVQKQSCADTGPEHLKPCKVGYCWIFSLEDAIVAKGPLRRCVANSLRASSIVDFLGTGVHVFHQFDLSLRASRAFVSNWVIAPMPGSLRIRWHKQGGEANDARSGPPLIGR